MSDTLWDDVGSIAGEFTKRAFGPKKDVELSEPPPLVDPSAMSAQQEQAAANSVAATTAPPVPAQTMPAPAMPMPQQAMQQAPQASAGMVPMQSTVSRNVIDPAALTKIDTANAAVNNALQSKAEADIAANTAVAQEQRMRAAIMEQQANESAAIMAKRQQEAKLKTDAVAQAATELGLKRKINPNRYMANAGVGGQIMAAIARGLGAFGAAITHSPNYAADMIDRAINADIEAQRVDLETLGEKVKLAQNDYANFRQQGLDDDAARTAAYQAKIMQANAKIDAVIAESKNPQIQASANEIKALNEQRAATSLAEYQKRQISTTSAVSQPSQPGSENQLRMRALEVEVPQKDPKTGKNLGTRTLLAKSPQDAEKVREALTVRNSLQTDLAELNDMVTKTSQSVSPVAKAKAEAKYKTIKTKLGVLYGLGALAQADLDIVSQLGDPTSIWQRDSTTVKLIDQLGGSLDANVEAQLRGRGLIK